MFCIILRSFHSELPNVGVCAQCAVNPCYMHQYLDVVTGPRQCQRYVLLLLVWSLGNIGQHTTTEWFSVHWFVWCDDVITLFSEPATMPCMMDPRLYLLCCKILELFSTSKHFHRTVYSIPENGFDVEL